MKKPRGFSLIELMVAITVGLILIAIIAQIYLSSKQTYRSQDDLSRMQEEGRYAIEMLSRYARLAGYHPDPKQDMATAFPATSYPIEGSTTGSLTLRHYGSGTAPGDNTVQNCLGDTIASSTLTYEKFEISGTALQCTTPAITAGVPSTGTTNADIVNNVTGFEVTYGEDTDGNGIPNRYVAAAAGTPWNNILTVRICVEIQSANDNLTATKQSYVACNGTSVTATDRRYHRTFKTTVALRNRLS